MMILSKNQIRINNPIKNSCNIAHLELTYEQYLKTESGKLDIFITCQNLLLKKCFKVASGYVNKYEGTYVQINFWDFEIIEKDLRRDIIIDEILN